MKLVARFGVLALSDALWIVPLLVLAALAFFSPSAPPIERGNARTVLDNRGVQVPIADPYRGSILMRGSQVTTYIEATNAPDTILAATASAMGDRVRGHIIGRIFPSVISNSRIWETEGLSGSNGAQIEAERLLTFDPGAVLGWPALALPFEQAGIPFVSVGGIDKNDNGLNRDVVTYASLVGNEARGRAILDRERENFAQLDLDLGDPSNPPTYLYILTNVAGGALVQLGASNHYTRFYAKHAGVRNACSCPYSFALIDAEQIAAEDPDIIIIGPQPSQEKPSEIMRDPRFQGLKAIKNHRVYRAPPGIDFFISASFWSRWLAELAHPDKLRPISRQLYRDYIKWLLNYELSDAELSVAFAVEDNKGMLHADRFEALP